MSKIDCDKARWRRPCCFNLFYRVLVVRECFPHGTCQPRSGASPPLLSGVRLVPTGNPFLDGLLETVLPLLPRGPRHAVECTPCTAPLDGGPDLRPTCLGAKLLRLYT